MTAIAVAGLASLSAVTLLFVVALSRRLRDVENRLSSMGTRPAAARSILPGFPIPDFRAETVAGSVVTKDDLLGATSVVGFFSTRCDSCRAQLADFVDLAERATDGPARALAIVSGNADEGATMVAALSERCTVVLEPDGGPVVTAVRMRTFPTFMVLDAQGAVAEIENAAKRLAAGAAVPAGRR